MEDEKQGKKYSLKNIELKLIESLQQSYFTNLSSALSFIAIERLAYDVTEFTRFRVENGDVTITEEKPEDEVLTEGNK